MRIIIREGATKLVLGMKYFAPFDFLVLIELSWWNKMSAPRPIFSYSFSEDKTRKNKFYIFLLLSVIKKCQASQIYSCWFYWMNSLHRSDKYNVISIVQLNCLRNRRRCLATLHQPIRFQYDDFSTNQTAMSLIVSRLTYNSLKGLTIRMKFQKLKRIIRIMRLSFYWRSQHYSIVVKVWVSCPI